MATKHKITISCQRANYLWLAILPACLFLSNFPTFSLNAIFGENTSGLMNLEFSLPEIWLVGFFLLNFGNLKSIFQFHKIALAIFLLPAYATLGLLYSAIRNGFSSNIMRGALTTGVLVLIIFGIIAALYHLHTYTQQQKTTLIRIFILTSASVAIFCWLQCVLDLLGAARDNTLLCYGCTYSAFGFPHPNGFAVEPQFMGNLLLAPALLSIKLLNDSEQKYFSRSHLAVLSILFSSTIFLTFSRGAIYAFIISLVLYLGITLFQSCHTPQSNKTNTLGRFPIIKYKDIFATITISVLAFIITLCGQGLFAQFSPTSDDFISAVTKVVHHLSLGKIDFRPSCAKDSSTPCKTQPSEQSQTDSESQDDSLLTNSNFNGYIEESTNIRTMLTGYALSVWSNSPTTMLFGVGLGSAGTAMYDRFPELGTPKEIVQNEYVSILLELGLIGYAIIIAIAIILAARFRKIHPNQSWQILLDLTPIVGAYLVSILFFSGLPNAVHIYLFPLYFFLCSPNTNLS